ncbi:MAG: thioredoxin family protein [Planctomycetia bacterium]|nr:thioredoxin family protein [Planctomycetia bacterium]
MLRSVVAIALRMIIAFFIGFTSMADAGEFNEVLSIGDKSPDWENLPGTDGKKHSLSDLKDKQIVVIVFTCLSCPTAVDYEERIDALAKQHAGADDKVAVVAVCVNRIDADRLPKLEARVKDKGFSFIYLADESQKIAKDFGAIFTPEFYVFDQDRKLVYMGAMDDNTDPRIVKQNFVEAAIAAVQKGEKPKITETLARGCRVRYVRERK